MSIAKVDADETALDEPVRAEAATSRAALRRVLRKVGPSTMAVLCYVVATPLALFVIRLADLDPMTLRGAVLPIAAGAAGAVVAVAFAVRFASERMAGAVAGLYSAWIAMVLMNALHGTPFAHYELSHWDTVRMSALANRLTTTWGSTDAFLPGLPSEYPVLYPWLIARASELLDRPTWTLVGDVEVLFISASALVAFLLWRRLVSPPVALAMAAVAPVVFTHAHKSYEILTLAVFVPWVLATFAGLPRRSGGMHWLPAGVIGGLFVCTYTGYLMFGAIGGLAIIVARLFRPERKRYLRHLLGVLVTAVVVSSWYVVPLLYAYLTKPREVVADTYPNADIAEDPIAMPFVELTPIGFLALAGLAGLFWYRRREWWAQPMLLLLAGIYLYWVIFMLRLVDSGHTGFFVKTPRMVSMILVTAGVLTVARLATLMVARMSLKPPRSAVIVALAALLVWCGHVAWQEWTPGDPKGFKDGRPIVDASQIEFNSGLYPHTEPVPDGEPTKFTPEGMMRWPLPVHRIEREVEARLGEETVPMSLSTEMRLYAYQTWWAYLQRGHYSANSLMLYNERHEELAKLTAIRDPQRFAAASASTRFGGIDVFLLREVDGRWRFNQRLAFAPESFRGGAFDIVEDLPANLVLAIRTQ